MAFQVAPGYNSLPNGNFSPTIFSKKAQLAFRKKSVIEEITNTEYMGEINNYGDTVRIIKEPEINIKSLARGTNTTTQDLDDEDFSLTIDQANYFQFGVDDIEEAHSHIQWMQLATDRAGYRLADNRDQEVLAYLSGYRQVNKHDVGSTVNTIVNGSKAIPTAGSDELLSTMKLSRPNFGNLSTPGSTGDSIPIAQRLPGASSLPTTYVSPVMLINRMATKLNQQNVPMEGRWIVLDPVFIEILQDEDSRFGNGDFGPNGMLRSGDAPAVIKGFRVFQSNNLPQVGTGAGTVDATDQDANYGVIVAGHSSAVATAEQLKKVEKFRSPNGFADICRGMHLYGRKILRPESIVTARYNLA